MSERKRDEIIKALECCYTNKLNCSDCPFQDTDKYLECSGLTLSAISLINELTEEIERLKKLNGKLQAKYLDKSLAYNEMWEELDEIKADTVRKMQSEIEARCIKGGIYPAFVKSTIDQIAEEMIGGNNGDKED